MSARLTLFLSFLLLLKTGESLGQNTDADSLLRNKIHGYQIHLGKPVKEIRLLMYEKDFLPIQGRLSEDRKAIIMDDYRHGYKVHVRVIYEDGGNEEFVRSPCYIDPVIEIP